MFISQNGSVSGAFNLDQRHFQVYTLENGFSVLLEDNSEIPFKCGSGGSDHSIPNIPTPTRKSENQGARMGVCTEPMRVLVVYTQAAADSVPNIGQTINLAVQQYNQAVDNSGIGSIPQTNKITLSGTELVTFTGSNPENASGIKQAAEFTRDNATVQNLRNQYNADLVMCFVGKEYTDGVGYATATPANNANYCAAVTASYASSTVHHVFAHEFGHLLGGRHEIDSGPPPYSHGFQFTASGSTFRTLMHTASGATQILNYSSPNVTFSGVATGTFGTNHVARVISENSLDIVNFRPSVTQPFNATIIGPTSIGNSGNYTWELYTFCRNFLTTTWQFSPDGFNYGPSVGFGDMVSNYYVDGSNNGTLYLRCIIITDQNQTYITTTTINVNICPGCRTANNPQTSILNDETPIGSVFPNPAANSLTINYAVDKSSVVQFEFVDMAGKSHIRQQLQKVPVGKHRQGVDITSLQSGLYICRSSIAGKVTTTPFIVSK